MKSRLDNIFSCMKQRCFNPKHPRFLDYNRKGMHSKWMEGKIGKQMFIEWALKNGYRDSLTIDRIDNNIGYYPDNCRWISAAENSRNTSNNKNRNNKHKYKGVKVFKDRNKKYVATCQNKFISSHYEEIEAGRAYNRYVIDNNLTYGINEDI